MKKCSKFERMGFGQEKYPYSPDGEDGCIDRP